MKSPLSKMRRYELLLLIEKLLQENEALQKKLQQAQDVAASNIEVQKELLKRICNALKEKTNEAQ